MLLCDIVYFTKPEYGVSMLSRVLNSNLTIGVNIMRVLDTVYPSQKDYLFFPSSRAMVLRISFFNALSSVWMVCNAETMLALS